MSVEVSIVIPTLNSPVIDRVLAAVRRQAFDLTRVEVLVVGQDELGLIVPDGLVQFLESERPLTPAQARNRGLAASRGQIVIFLDADCVPEDGWLVRLLAPFANPDVHVVGGSMALVGTDFWTLADNVATFHEYLHICPSGLRELLPTFSLGCRRLALEMVGGFDETYPYPAGEDADLTLRLRLAGYALHFEPTAVVRHYPSRSRLKSVLHHAYRFGQYSVKVDPRYAEKLAVPWVLRRPWWTLLAAPLLAGGVTWQVFWQVRKLRRLWLIAPVVFIAKLAWCVGAARTLQHGTSWKAARQASGPEEVP